MSTGEAKASGMTDDDIRRVKDSEPRWVGEESMLFRNFKVNYAKSATTWLASNNGTAAGVGAATAAERDDAEEADDGFMPRGAPDRVRFHNDGKLVVSSRAFCIASCCCTHIDLNIPLATYSAEGTTRPHATSAPSPVSDLSTRFRSATLSCAYAPSFTTMCRLGGRCSFHMPPGASLVSAHQLVYTFQNVEEDGVTPYQGVGVFLGPMPKGLVLDECPVDVIDNKYLTVLVPSVQVLTDVKLLVKALCALGAVITPTCSRYQGIVNAVGDLPTSATHSLYIIELPFKCNKELHHDGPCFPDRRFIEFVPKDSKESIVFLHLQLRSYSSPVPEMPLTASTASCPVTRVNIGDDNGVADDDSGSDSEYYDTDTNHDPQPQPPASRSPGRLHNFLSSWM